MPDDAALAAPHVLLRGAHAEVLVVAADLLGSGVEDDEVVDQFEKAGLGADLEQRAVERVVAGAVLLPDEVVLLRCLDGAVAQALGVVAGHHPLHRREEVLDEDLLLVVEVLADACLSCRNVRNSFSSMFAVALARGPVAEMVVPELLAEQLHHACLGLLLDLADGRSISNPRVSLVKRFQP